MNIKSLYQIFQQYPNVCTDTRKITRGCLFFALKGANFNGNQFAEDALQKGAAYAVIDEAEFAKDDRYILTEDVLATLQQLATCHREQLDIPVIAIVGSNGKTTTKELITSVLSQSFNVHATIGNFNNHIGLPLTLLQLKKEHEVAIIEMGANHIGENAFLCEIAKPNLGLITNNGKDHLEGFGSMEGVVQSNSELYYYLLKNNGLAFVNACDEWLMRMATRLQNKKTYAANHAGRNVAADYAGMATSLIPQIIFSINEKEVTANLSGDYNFDNIMAAVSLGLYFNMNTDAIKAGIENYVPQNNRSQILKKASNTIYLDAYNANPSSMEAALKNFASLTGTRKVAVLGDMFELGEYEAAEHKSMIELCTQLKLDEVILVGKAFHAQNSNTDFHSFETTEQARAFLQENKIENAAVFIKGSRGMKLETLVDVI